MANSATHEAVKDTGRMAVFGSISSVVTYFIQTYFPDMPNEVIAAILVLLMAGLTYADSWIHNRKDIKATGIVSF